MASNKKDYPNLLIISLSILFYISSTFVKNDIYHSVLLILSIGLIFVVLFDPLFFYSKNLLKKSNKLFWFIIAGLIIAGISIFLFFMIGAVVAFYVAICTFTVSYILTGISLFCKKKK